MADIELVIKVPECFYEYCKAQTDATEIQLAVAKGIPLPEQQPCEDCISRQEALSHKHIVYDDDGIGYSVVRVDEIMALSSVTPTRPTGKWIEKEDYNLDIYYDCSECGESFCLIDGTPTDYLYNYCPNCGARMAESEEEK